MAASLVSFLLRTPLKALITHSSRVIPRVHDHVSLRLFATGEFQNVIVERRGKQRNVGIVKLNRPKVLNALNDALLTDVGLALEQFERDKAIRCIIITGSDRAFSIGADVAEMGHKTFQDVIDQDFPASFYCIFKCRKPLIAAVNGYALGGGCEVAMMCDIVYAGHRAQFAQPEITLGTIPGAGGTQLLPRAVGKSRAMEMMLTGCRISAQEAQQIGLVSKVFPATDLLDAAVNTAEKIAGYSPLAVTLCKEAVNTSQEVSLSGGSLFEKLFICASAATKDAKEGLNAFVEKRTPVFTGD